jgi:hypothetical protein
MALHEEKEECSDNESSNNSMCKLSPQSNASTVILRRKSRGNPLFRKSEGGGRADSEGTHIRLSILSYFYKIIFKWGEDN